MTSEAIGWIGAGVAVASLALNFFNERNARRARREALLEADLQRMSDYDAALRTLSTNCFHSWVETSDKRSWQRSRVLYPPVTTSTGLREAANTAMLALDKAMTQATATYDEDRRRSHWENAFNRNNELRSVLIEEMKELRGRRPAWWRRRSS